MYKILRTENSHFILYPYYNVVYTLHTLQTSHKIYIHIEKPQTTKNTFYTHKYNTGNTIKRNHRIKSCTSLMISGHSIKTHADDHHSQTSNTSTDVI